MLKKEGDAMPISKNVDANIAVFQKRLDCEHNFDIVYRTLIIGGKQACMFFIDGFIKDDIVTKIMEHFYLLDDPKLLASAHTFSHHCVPYCEVGLNDDVESLLTNILSGMLILFVEGFDKAVEIDARTYPQRSTSEPDKDKTFRGSRDGFVETLVLNTALIRRRIRYPGLCVEHMQLGELSKTDIALCYIGSRCDQQLLNTIRDKIQTSHIQALTMNQETLAEVLLPHKWYNPFPKFKYTERPDTAAAQLLEGDIVLLVDNSPQAMILPVTLFDIVEEANDYYFPPLTGTYLRLTRLFTALFTLLFTPLWLYFLSNPQLIPPWLSFITLKETPQVPVIVQLILLELAIDGLRLASLNTPNMLTTSLSMIGAIVVGDFAVQSGWFSPETMLYMAFVAIATHTQPGYELGYALKFMRLMLLILTALFPIWGFWLGIGLIFVILLSNKTIGRKSYLYPLIPFNYKDFKKKVLRIKID